MIAEAGFSAVVEPSLETGGILDAPLWGMMAEFGNGCLWWKYIKFVMKKTAVML